MNMKEGRWIVYKIINTVKNLTWIGITSKSELTRYWRIIASSDSTSGSPKLAVDYKNNPDHFCYTIIDKDLTSRRDAKEIALTLQNELIQKGESYLDNEGGHRKKAYNNWDRIELACTSNHKEWFVFYCHEILDSPLGRVFDSWIEEKMKEFDGFRSNEKIN